MPDLRQVTIMTRITLAMAEHITAEALRWYAALLASGRTEFSAADFPDLPERTLRWYLAQLRQGWCDIRVVRRAQAGRPTVYGLPPAADDQVGAAAQERAAAFASSWAARPESAQLPFSAADYAVLQAVAPATITPEAFNRALTSKLLELAGSDLARNARSGLRLAWLRTGLLRLLASMPAPGTTPPAGRTPPESRRDPMQLSPEEEEINRRAVERLRGWRPPPISPQNGPLVPPVEWDADVPVAERLHDPLLPTEVK